MPGVFPMLGQLLKFVVLRHEGIARPHFDLMFETSPGSLLATWQADVWPMQLGKPYAMKRIFEHRAAYLTYEGPISNDRGIVSQVHSGSFVALVSQASHWTLRLQNPDQVLEIAVCEESLWTAVLTNNR